MDFFKKFARRGDAPAAGGSATAKQKALDYRAVYDRVQGAEAQRLLGPMAAAFVAAYRGEEPFAGVEKHFGTTQLVCLDWCRLLRDQLRDVWDDQADPRRNAQKAMALMSNALSQQQENVADVLEAVSLCAKLERNVPAFVESAICATLVQFLEACLEYESQDARGAKVVELVLATLGHVMRYPSMCDALAGTPTLFLLFTLPVREATALNASSFCVSCAKTLLPSVAHWTQAVHTSLCEQNWMGFVWARLDDGASQVAPACAATMTAMMAEALRQSAAKFDGALWALFVQEDAYVHFQAMIKHLASRNNNNDTDTMAAALQILSHLADLVYVGKDALPAPVANPLLQHTTAQHQQEASALPSKTVETDRVRNLRAFAALQSCFVTCPAEAVRTKVVDICFGIFACHPHNYLLLQQQHTFGEFLEHFDALSLPLRKRILGYLVALEEQLHFVPFHELMALSLLLDRAPTAENAELVRHTVQAFIDRNLEYRSFLEQAGMIHIAAKVLRGAASHSSTNLSEAENAAASAARWSSYGTLLQLLTLLVTEHPANCGHLIKAGVGECLGPMLLKKQTRSAAMRLFSQLMVLAPERAGDMLAILLALMRNHKDDKWLAIDVLSQLSLLLANRWPLKEAFREVGGFVSIISLLMTLDGAFGLGLPSDEASTRVVVCILDTCSAAIAGYAENRAFFCNHVLPSLVGSLRLTGILVTAKEARTMLLALIRFMTDAQSIGGGGGAVCGGGPTATAASTTTALGDDAFRAQLTHCAIEVGEMVLVLLELLQYLSDENKFFLLECLSDMAMALRNKERMAQHSAVHYVLQQYEDLICNTQNALVERLLEFVVRVASHHMTQQESVLLFRMMRKHGYPSHLLRAARKMTERSRFPHVVEFNLGGSGGAGFACLKLLPGTLQAPAGSSWPPQNGWTVHFWVCIEDFAGRTVDLCSFCSAEGGPPLTRLCVSPAGHLQFYASKGLEWSTVRLQQRQWYHVALVWQKRRFSSPEVTLYVDGDALFTASVPPMLASVPLEQVYMVMGTPPEDKQLGCKQLWWLGPVYLLDECLDSRVVLTMFTLGPGYYANFQASSFEQYQMPNAVTSRALDLVARYGFPNPPLGCLDLAQSTLSLDEGRLMAAVHARSLDRLAGSDTRILRNGVPSRATGQFAEALLLGGANAFENRGFAHSVHKVGAMPAALLVCHEAQDSFLDALRLVVALTQSSWRNAQLLDSSHECSYDVLAHVLSLQVHRLSLETVDILWELIGLRTPDPNYDVVPEVVAFVPPLTATPVAVMSPPFSPSAPQRVRDPPAHGVLSNTKAFVSLFLSWIPWRGAPLKLQAKILEDIGTLVAPANKHSAYNIWALERLHTVSRLLALAREEGTPVELFAALGSFVTLMLQVSPHRTLEVLCAFLLTTVPVPDASATLKARKRSTTMRPEADVSRVISLRNLLLDIVLREMGNQMAVFEAHLTPEWVAQWMDSSLHSSTLFLGLRLVASMLHRSAAFAKQFANKGGWKWMTSRVALFHPFAQAVYLLVALMQGVPGNSVPAKMRGDFGDLAALFPAANPVVHPECLLVMVNLLKETLVWQINAIGIESAPTSAAPTRTRMGAASSRFVPIGADSDSDDDDDAAGESTPVAASRRPKSSASAPVTPWRTPSPGDPSVVAAAAAAAPPKTEEPSQPRWLSAENMVDQRNLRPTKLASYRSLMTYLLLVFDSDAGARNLLCGSNTDLLERVVQCMFPVGGAVNIPLEIGAVVRDTNGLPVPPLMRDRVMFADVHRMGEEFMRVLVFVVHQWVVTTETPSKVVDVLLPLIPPDTPPYQVSLFVTRLMRDVLTRCKQNVTAKDLDANARLAENLARVLCVACDLTELGLFEGGDRRVWECCIELMEMGEKLIAEKRGILLFGKSKLAPLFRPLCRSALLLLANRQERSWMMNQLVYHQRLVLNQANDDKAFLQALISHLVDLLVSDSKEMRDASMSIFKLLLIVWEPVMQELLVIPAASKGVPARDVLRGGFDLLLQGTQGFQMWLGQNMELVSAVVGETCSKPYQKLSLAQVKTLNEMETALLAKRYKLSTRAVEREQEVRAAAREVESARLAQLERAHPLVGVSRARERILQQERAQYRALMWSKAQKGLQAERAVLGSDAPQRANTRWKLAPVEGPFRMRLRLEENPSFNLPSDLLLKEGSVIGANNTSSSSSLGGDSSVLSTSTGSLNVSGSGSVVRSGASVVGDAAVATRSTSLNVTRMAVDSEGDAITPLFRKLLVSPESRRRNSLVLSSGDSLGDSPTLSDPSVTLALSFGSGGVGEANSSMDGGGATQPQQQTDASSGNANNDEDENGEAVEDEEAKLDRIQRFLDGGDKVHFRNMFNVGRVTGMSKSPALLLICQESVYVIDDFVLDRETMEVLEVERESNASGSVTAGSGGEGSSGSTQNSRSPSPAAGAGGVAVNSATGGGGGGRRRADSVSLLPRSVSHQDLKRSFLLGHDASKWAYLEIADISQKRYLLQNVAIEIFSIDGRNEFFCFEDRKSMSDAWKLLQRAWQAQKTRAAAVIEETRQPWLKVSALMMIGSRSEDMTSRWRSGAVSNFEYLMWLNTCAGRTYNDLTQYPVFPWILSAYESASLDLTSPAVYRDLSKPMGAQNAERAAMIKMRYDSMVDTSEHDAPAFHYGTHYSSAAAVLHFLVRMEPFLSQMVWELQDGRLDHPDRMFFSVDGTWKSCSGATRSTSDVKELIPEWFCLPDFLRNHNRIKLGERTSPKQTIDHVELPPWAMGSEHLFIAVNRMALESEYVSQHLHEWIDLIFGYKQRGAEAAAALNVFHFLSYEGEVNIDEIEDPLERKATVDAIFNFGQTPRQLFTKPHPPKQATEAYRTALEHPLTRISRAKAAQQLSFELLRESGGRVERMVLRGGNVVLLVGPLRCTLPGFGAKCVRADLPDESLRLCALEGGRVLHVLEGVHDGRVSAMCSSGSVVVTGGMDGVVALCAPRVVGSSGAVLEVVKRVTGHRGAITAVAVSHPWSILVSAATDNVVLLWDQKSMSLLCQMEVPNPAREKDPAPVTSIAVDERTGHIALANRYGLYLYDVNGRLLAVLHTPQISCVTFLDAHFLVLGAVALATGHADGVVRLYRIDVSLNHDIQLGVDLGDKMGPKAATTLPFVLQEAYAYTAHVGQRVECLLVLPDGLVSADDKGRVVRAVSRDKGDVLDVKIDVL